MCSVGSGLKRLRRRACSLRTWERASSAWMDCDPPNISEVLTSARSTARLACSHSVSSVLATCSASLASDTSPRALFTAISTMTSSI